MPDPLSGTYVSCEPAACAIETHVDIPQGARIWICFPFHSPLVFLHFPYFSLLPIGFPSFSSLFPCFPLVFIVFSLVFLHFPHFLLVFHWFSLVSLWFSFIFFISSCFPLVLLSFFIGFPTFSSPFAGFAELSLVFPWLSLFPCFPVGFLLLCFCSCLPFIFYISF